MSYETIKTSYRVARKRHVCDWCGQHIEKGEKYRYEAFKFDGDFNDWHSHLACSRIVSAIWDYADPGYEGMDSDYFNECCADVCRMFVCPECKCWIPQFEECELDEPYCIDELDKFFETHELYPVKEGHRCVWKCREKEILESESKT